MLDGNTTNPLYMQLRERLRGDLAAGVFRSGDRLPGEHALCQQYGVSRTTVRQALAELVAEGLLVAVRGKGTFVAGAGTAPAGVDSGVMPGRGTLEGGWIGLVAPFPGEYLMPMIVAAVEEELRPLGFGVRVFNSADDPEEEARMIERMVSEGAAGIIVMPAEEVVYSVPVSRLQEEGFPVVLIDRPYRYVSSDCVMADNLSGAREAVQHLLRLGHTRIGFVARSTAETYTVALRHEGYRFTLEQAGIKPKETHILFHDIYRQGSGGEKISLDTALQEYLGRKDRPSAVFAVNDLVAMDVIRIASGLGLRVPEDLAVVGFDDVSVASRFMVPLTTVRQPVDRIGREAARLLAGRLVEPARERRWIYVPASLVVRSSCGAVSRVESVESRTTGA